MAVAWPRKILQLEIKNILEVVSCKGSGEEYTPAGKTTSTKGQQKEVTKITDSGCCGPKTSFSPFFSDA